MGKKFVGLDGLKHFWTKVKTWVAGQITAEVTAKIAEIVANAPEDLDTLKEIADWISTHANDASAMNTQINTNKNDIAALQTSVAGKADTGHTHDDRYYTESEVDKKLAGKSNVEHTHTKSEITDFAHTHDDRYFTETEVTSKLAGKSDTGHKHSASDITSGVLPVAKGGTGATNAADGFNTLADGVRDSSTPRDDEKMLLKPAGPWYKTTCLDFWNYIKDKISSVLGLTKDNYGGTAAAILDYNRNTPIKVRWGGAGINSAEWYPAFNADGSALEPINRTNIHAGTADKVASTGDSGMWIQGRANAICKTTSAAGGGGWKTLASIKTSSGSIEIGNLSDEDFIRVVYSSDADVNAGNNNVTQLLYIRRGNIETPHEFIANSAKASSKMVIPIGAPSSLEDGCIWIER